MPLSTIIDSIFNKHKKRQAAHAADFRGIVIQIADGREPDADRVDAVLHDAGKSLDDLRQAVEQLQHRRQLRENWDRLPGVAAEREDIEKQLAAAQEALDDAEQRHAETTNPLIARLNQIRDAMMAADAAKRELANTCTDPALLAEVAAVVAKLTAAYREATQCRDAARAERDRAKAQHIAAERAKAIWRGDEQVKDYLARAKEHERKAAEFEGGLAKVDKQIAALEREEAAIREQMLVP